MPKSDVNQPGAAGAVDRLTLTAVEVRGANSSVSICGCGACGIGCCGCFEAGASTVCPPIVCFDVE